MMRPFFSFLALLFFTASVHASPLIWAGLFLGENRPTGPQAPPSLTYRLQEVFGFSNYKLIKGVNIDLRSPWDHWVVARKDFFLRIKAVPPVPGGPDRLEYEIYKDGFIVARGLYVVAYDTPLFINGPDFHRGRLIFVVEQR
jgi:hypothetical protein